MRTTSCSMPAFSSRLSNALRKASISSGTLCFAGWLQQALPSMRGSTFSLVAALPDPKTPFQRADDRLDVIRCRDAREGGESETPSLFRHFSQSIR